jgi:hypothetical protein
MNAVKTVLAVTVLLLFAWGVPPRAADEESEVKRMMHENFRVVDAVLVGLVTAHYDGMPEKIELIRDHAQHLSQNVPEKIDADARRTFVTYAANLEYKSANLITVLKELIARDKQRPDPGVLSIDYMRAVAASHFGDIVTTCVLCHNQFRRAVLK